MLVTLYIRKSFKSNTRKLPLLSKNLTNAITEIQLATTIKGTAVFNYSNNNKTIKHNNSSSSNNINKNSNRNITN